MASTVHADTIKNAAGTGGPTISGKVDGLTIASPNVGQIIRPATVNPTHVATALANAGIALSSAATTTLYMLYKSATIGDAAKLDLTAGVWRVDAGINFGDTANPATVTLLQLYIGTVTTAASITSAGDNIWYTRALKETSTSGTYVTAKMSTQINVSGNQSVYMYALFQGAVTASWSFDTCWFVGTRIA